MLAMTNSIELPTWLSPSTDPAIKPLTQADRREIAEKQFEIAFPRIMDMIADGYHLSTALKEYPANIQQSGFRRWIKKDPSREAAYKNAKELRADVWADLLLRRASGEEGLNDVARDKLFCDNLRWIMAADNRREYGNHTTVETHQSINLNAVLEMANARLPGRIIDHEDAE